ncbi:hypothetical protein [Paenibacillus ginsengarvi]|uniref:hypothetical protein n=1 Tax=Paenibacillus ginsengarvi TaxID=400777 RepID=UPI0011C3CA55|nr:hypothetical protein [Paenibacillus ginsengarvi]
MLESEISGTVARAMAKIIERKALLYNLHSMPNWMPLQPLLGFEGLPGADSVTARGVVYQAFPCWPHSYRKCRTFRRKESEMRHYRDCR